MRAFKEWFATHSSIHLTIAFIFALFALIATTFRGPSLGHFDYWLLGSVVGFNLGLWFASELPHGN